MLGLSFAKLLVLVLIIVGVWYGFRVFGRLERRRQNREVGRGTAGRGAPVKMEQCPVCNTYVAPDTVGACGRSACPY